VPIFRLGKDSKPLSADASAPRRAIFYLESSFISGAEAQILRNAEFLIDLGVHLKVIAVTGTPAPLSHLRSKNKRVEELVVSNYKLLQLPTNNPALIVALDQIRLWVGLIRGYRAVKSWQPEVLHINNGGFPGAAGSRGFAIGAKLACPKAKIFMTVNNLAVDYKPLPRKLDFLFDRALVQCVSMWITGSRAASARLRDVLGLRDGSTCVVPNGIPRLSCSEVETKCSVQIAMNELDSSICLSVGHLEPRKGHEVLIKAISTLQVEKKLAENWVFLIEGLGRQEKHLRSLVEKMGLTSRVRLIGHSPCVFHLIQRCDIFVHPSISNEDLPNVISEAMSLGKPIIGSRLAGIPEQIDEGANGFLVAPGEAPDLATKLEILIRDSKLRETFGRTSAVKYEREFLPEVALESYRRLYGLDDSFEH
jgi:glycosyltransferase involved in cell wall biosynthesis